MAYFSNSRDLCPSVKSIILLDSEGKRVAVKYYSDDWPTNSAKLAFEKALFVKTLRTNADAEAEITLMEDKIVIYKFVEDLHFFVTGSDGDNEIILASVLQGFVEAVSVILRKKCEKGEALENLDLIFLCIDEIIDRGLILETEAAKLVEKVLAHSIDSDSPLSEQTIAQALATAGEHLTKTLLK